MPFSLIASVPLNKVEQTNYTSQLRAKLEESYDWVRAKLKRSFTYQRRYYDRHIKEEKFHIDDKVWLFLPRSKGIASRNFNRKWEGPYKIKRCLPGDLFDKQKEENSEKVVHGNRLRKFYRNENYGETELPQQKELLRNVNDVEETIEEQYENEVHDDRTNFRAESNDNYNEKNSQTLER